MKDINKEAISTLQRFGLIDRFTIKRFNNWTESHPPESRKDNPRHYDGYYIEVDSGAGYNKLLSINESEAKALVDLLPNTYVKEINFAYEVLKPFELIYNDPAIAQTREVGDVIHSDEIYWHTNSGVLSIINTWEYIELGYLKEISIEQYEEYKIKLQEKASRKNESK